MTISETLHFFAEDRRIVEKLQPLVDVGLGYLRLGQNTASLSGGEAQRLKLASFLAAQKSDKKYLLLFDEPTTGLHIADVRVLLQVFQRLVNAGHSLVVIEHNVDLITQCDWIIDLGPEGGDGGGEVVASGPVRSVAKVQRSHTAEFLRERIKAAKTAEAEVPPAAPPSTPTT
jgi:excinuclease ABC subunit A